MKKILATLSLIFASVAIFVGTTIFVPTLLEPDDGDGDLMPDVELDWEAVAGSVNIYYEIQIANDENFSDPFSANTDLTAFNAPILNFATTYYWRVRAIDGDLTSDWSEVWAFTIIDVFDLDKPRNNATDVDPDERLEWKGQSSRIDLSGFESFEIQLDTSENFNSEPPYHIVIIEDAELLYDDNEGHYESSNLLFGEKFFWRVRGIHQNDVMDWSEVYNFTVIDGTELDEPTEGEIIDPAVTFKWDKVDGINNYLFQISQDENFQSAPTTTVYDDEIDSDTLTFGATYFWRVAVAHDLDVSDYTEPWSVTVVSEPTLDAPENNSTNVDTRPQLKWKAMSGPTAFTLQISYSEDFNNAQTVTLENTNNPSTEKYTIPSAIDSAKVVYWRVKALINDEQESDWSEVWKFTIAGTGIEEAELFDNISIFPNPSNGNFTLTLDNAEGDDIELQILDMVGKVVYNETISLTGITTKNIKSSLPEGIYVLKLIKGDETYTDKITIQ